MEIVVYSNPLHLSDEQFDTIAALAALGYSTSQMAMYLEEDLWEFVKAKDCPDSKIEFYITKGKLQADFEIGEKLLENAKSGNLTAVMQYDLLRKKTVLEEMKARVLYGE